MIDPVPDPYLNPELNHDPNPVSGPDKHWDLILALILMLSRLTGRCR